MTSPERLFSLAGAQDGAGGIGAQHITHKHKSEYEHRQEEKLRKDTEKDLETELEGLCYVSHLLFMTHQFYQ